MWFVIDSFIIFLTIRLSTFKFHHTIRKQNTMRNHDMTPQWSVSIVLPGLRVWHLHSKTGNDTEKHARFEVSINSNILQMSIFYVPLCKEPSAYKYPIWETKTFLPPFDVDVPVYVVSLTITSRQCRQSNDLCAFTPSIADHVHRVPNLVSIVLTDDLALNGLELSAGICF